jgi:ribosomal protein S27E
MRQAAITDRSPHSPPYKRHRTDGPTPRQTLLYQIIERHYSAFKGVMAAQGKPLPKHVQQEFDEYLKCGRLEHGFVRVQCTACRHEHLVAFSCKRRGFCPSCGARRMAESAALLVDEVFPEQPVRQWVGIVSEPAPDSIRGLPAVSAPELQAWPENPLVLSFLDEIRKIGC